MSALPWLRAADALRRRRSVLTCYHGVGSSRPEDDPHFLRVPETRFRRQVELLRDAGFEFVTVAEFVDRSGDGRPPAGLAVLSFDDGMEDNHSVVLPLLRSYGIPATVYVRTDAIGQPNPSMRPGSGYRMMTEAELRELAAAGFEIGAHTVNHPDLSELDEDACLREMVASKQRLEELTGVAVRTFAYPYCTYNAAAIAAARRAGFTAAVTCQGRGSWERYELKRALITGKDGLPSFLLKLDDRYHPIFHSKPARAWRAVSRRPRRRIRRLLQSRGSAAG